jgi:anti-sigma-K factor RskA
VVERVVERTVEVPAPAPRPPTPAEQRAALLAEAPDARTIGWSATPDPAARGATGDVVWSEARQQGYMRIRGLAPNDPARAQYQLWIFDGRRDPAHPVDGGVFDVAAGEVVVPIHAAIRVFAPKLFAVTVERPGGVVVSKRERIVLTAAL